MDDNVKMQTGPLQKLFVDVKKIIDFMEVKNKKLADANETEESAAYAEVWIAAKKEEDSYLTYKNWWTKNMFFEVDNSITTNDFQRYLKEPYSVPMKYRDTLLKEGREAFMEEYEEKNSYYRMLYGLPSIDTKEEDYIYLSEELCEEYNADPDTPVHELSSHIQDMYMTTEEYQTVLKENPDKEYLKYLGIKKIDPYTARLAKDFEIIRYPQDRSAINPSLLSGFSELYNNYREYVMVVLYNRHLEDSYVGYRDFMGFLIMSFALMQIGNKALEERHAYKFLDDTTIYTLFSMYNIPESLILTKETRRKLASRLLKLIKEKGTTSVYYDIIEILGYQDIIINKLMLMRGDEFNEDGTPKGTVNPYFLALDLLDNNPYETIASGKAKIYDYKEITNADPTWWGDDPEVQSIVETRDYTMSDSKYITLEATIHQMQYMFESIYFSKMVMDNKDATSSYMVEIPELFGSEMVSVYDITLGLICATCLLNKFTGEISTEYDKLFAMAGFNFDFDMDLFNEFLDTTKYVDKQRILSYLSDITINDESDLSRLMNDVMYPLRQWLETKIVRSEIREEYLEYEAIYRALFTYDANRNKFLDDFEMPMEIIRERYDLTEDNMTMLKHFYPRKPDGTAITVEEFNESFNNTNYYYPFLSLTYEVDWYVHIIINDGEDRGYLYFHDILNSEDITKLKNSNGDYIFMDYINDDWVINQTAIKQAISLIEALNNDSLKNAYFQIYTPIEGSGGKYYEANQRLDPQIRTDVFKDIFIDKINMDAAGLCYPPKTYFELLERSNPTLYAKIVDRERIVGNKDGWINDIMSLITAMEAELDLHMKYYEQSIVGNELFFKPLITLIKRFKSTLVEIAKTSTKLIFDDKMDVGGNSNMVKFFDEMDTTIHFTPIAGSGFESQFGLFDFEHSNHRSIIIKDRSELYKMIHGTGFAAQEIRKRMGSMWIVDEMKFYKNGKELDPSDHTSMWYVGEPNSGRWEQDEDILFRTRDSVENVKNKKVDLEGWKDFVDQ